MNLLTDTLTAQIPESRWRTYDLVALHNAHNTVVRYIEQVDVLSSRQRIYFSDLQQCLNGIPFSQLHYRFDGLIKIWDIYHTALRTFAFAVEKQADLIKHAQSIISQLAERYSFQVLHAEYDGNSLVRDTTVTHVKNMIAFVSTELDNEIAKHITHTRGLLTALCVQARSKIQRLTVGDEEISQKSLLLDSQQAARVIAKLENLLNENSRFPLTEPLEELTDIWVSLEKSISELSKQQYLVIDSYLAGMRRVGETENYRYN